MMRLCRLAPPRSTAEKAILHLFKRFFCALCSPSNLLLTRGNVPPSSSASSVHPSPPVSISASTAEKAILHGFRVQEDLSKAQAEVFKAQVEVKKYMAKSSRLQLEKQSLQFQISQLRLQVLRLVYHMKVRGVLELFVSFAKRDMDQRGIQYTGQYPFHQIVANFPELKACLKASTGRSEEKDLVQTLYSLLTFVNGLHHPVVNQGETIIVPRQAFDGTVYDRVLVCIGRIINMTIVFTEEQVQEGEAKANGDDHVQGGVSDPEAEE